MQSEPAGGRNPAADGPQAGQTTLPAGPADPGQAGGDELSLLDMAAVLWRRRWLILAAVAVCIGFAALYIVVATPIYESQSKVYVQRTTPRLVSEAQAFAGGSKSYLHTQGEVMVSSPVIQRALEQLDWKRLRTFHQVDNPALNLKNKLKVNVGREDDLVRVSMESPHRHEAARIVNAVVQSYIAFHNKQKRSTAAEVKRILREEKVRRDEQLTKNLKELMRFKREHTLLALEGEGGNITSKRLERLSQEMTEAQVKAVEARARVETLEKIVDDPQKCHLFLAKEDTGKYAPRNRLMKEISKIEDELANLRSSVTGDHSGVAKREQELAKKRSELREIEQRLVRSRLEAAREEFHQEKFKLDELRAAIKKQREKMLKLREQQTRYRVLESEYERTRKLVNLLDERIKEISVDEQAGALNVEVLETAKVGENPVWPNKPVIGAAALALGLMLGGGLSLLMDALDPSLRSVEEAGHLTGLPLIGTVPAMSGKTEPTERGRLVADEPRSPVAEAIRTIRTGVLFSLKRGESCRLMVTSPAPKDGKSTIVSNLGHAMAQAGHRTIIVDADMRAPMQHRLFRFDDESANGDVAGLSPVLAGRMAVDGAIHRTETDGLDVLPCGPTPPNPAELLNTEAFRTLIADLRERYEIVLIDTPPVLPVADSRIVAPSCDEVLLVLQMESSHRKGLQQATRALASVGAPLLGVIANVVQKGSRYGYYSDYGYGSYYGYGTYGERGERSERRKKRKRSRRHAASGSGKDRSESGDTETGEDADASATRASAALSDPASDDRPRA